MKKKSSIVEKQCQCGNIFSVERYRENTAKYCSLKCRSKFRNYELNAGNFIKNEDESSRARHNVPQKCGIYKITNPNNEVYIGGSRTVYRRWLRHREARKKINIHLSIKKFGWREHKFEIVHELPLDVSDDTLLIYEQFYMDAYRNSGFNMLNVKDAGSKAKFSEESKINMSIAQRNRYAKSK